MYAFAMVFLSFFATSRRTKYYVLITRSVATLTYAGRTSFNVIVLSGDEFDEIKRNVTSISNVAKRLLIIIRKYSPKTTVYL